MTDDIDNDGKTLHESGGVELPELPKPLVGWRNLRDGYTADQMRAYALAALAASPLSDGWVSVEERMPPAVMYCMVYGRKYGTRPNTRVVFMTFISTRPRECVEDEEITHWMPLPKPPTAEDRSQS